MWCGAREGKAGLSVGTPLLTDISQQLLDELP